MKRASLMFAVLLTAIAAFGQSNLTTPASSFDSFAVGNFYAPAYIYQTNVFGGGSTAGGTYSVTLYSGAVTTQDGRRYAPFGGSTLPPITIGSGATMETVTPSSATGCGNLNTGIASQGSCSLTATFNNAHGRGDQITSGDQGYIEAVNDAANNGGGQVFWTFDTGPLTLATGGATTTYSQPATGGAPSNFFPNNAFVLGVIGRVTTTITGCASGWEIGDGTTAARFTAVDATLTAGETQVNTGAAWTTAIASATTGFKMGANKSMVLTCTGSNASAGAVKVRAWGITPVASAF